MDATATDPLPPTTEIQIHADVPMAPGLPVRIYTEWIDTRGIENNFRYHASLAAAVTEARGIAARLLEVQGWDVKVNIAMLDGLTDYQRGVITDLRAEAEAITGNPGQPDPRWVRLGGTIHKVDATD